MSALDRKLLRMLRRIWAQALAIALVLGCGVMVLIGSDSTRRTLALTQETFYDRQRFADVWSSVTRAPVAVLDEIAAIDGVAQVEGRITLAALLDIEGMAEPATGRIFSIGPGGGGLNRPILRSGRLPDPAQPDEVALSEPFGEAHGLVPGSRLRGVLNGQARELRVTGWMLSPEFVYTMPPGTIMPDNRRFGILWMSEAAAAAAADMDGAVNDIALRLTRDADERAVIAALDAILERWGGAGAFGRDRQQSHAFLASELESLDVMARWLPPVFFLVSAFLVNMVLGRLIAGERSQIGLLRAVGYSARAIAWHYVKLALLVGLVSLLVGLAGGLWMGSAMVELYAGFFRFPFVVRDPGQAAIAVAGLLAAATVLAGAGRAVRAAARLPPAEAMQTPVPPAYSRDRLDRAIVRMRLRQTTMMILRSILRWPGRAAITLFGVAASVAVLVTAYFMVDAINFLSHNVFELANRQQVTITLARDAPERAVLDARALPGVRIAEGAYSMPVRLVHGHRSRLSVLVAHFDGATLARLIDDEGQAFALPAEGVVLPEFLAGMLGARVGTRLRIELLAPPRETLELPVTALIAQGLGREAHVAAPALFVALRMAPRVNAVNLAIDTTALPALNAAVKATPAIAGLSDWAEVRRNFDATLARTLLTMIAIFTTIGALIAVGVVYNAARIQLAERSHELATLRVLGFTRLEVGYVLVGEMMLLAFLAVPFGWVAGHWLAAGLNAAVTTEVMGLPFHISRTTYAMAALAVLAAALGAALLVRRRLDRIDLVSALKARD